MKKRITCIKTPKIVLFILINLLFQNIFFAQAGYPTSGWNVLVYHEGSDASNLRYFNFTNYLGFYATGDDGVSGTSALPACTTIGAGSFSFNTADELSNQKSTPTLVAGYMGAQTPAAPYPNDGFTIWAKKTNVTCGYYKLYMVYYDDGARVIIDQDGDGTPEYNSATTNRFVHPPCTTGFPNSGPCQQIAWEGFLGANSRIDVQCFDWFRDNTDFTINVAFLKQDLQLSATNSSPYCPGQNINLNTFTNPNPTCLPVTYQWSGPNGFNSTQQNPTVVNASAAAAGTYTVTVPSSSAACGSVPLQATTNVILNSVTANATNDGNKCAGENINLSATPNGAIYQWSGPNGFTSTQQNPNISNVTSSNSGTYNVTVTVGACSSTSSTLVTVLPLPTVAINANPTPICAGQSVTLSTAPSNFSIYQWNQSGVGNVGVFTTNPTISSSYSVTVTDANGCKASNNYNLTVNPAPNVNILGNLKICLDGNTSLTASTAAAGATYLWSNGTTTPNATFNQAGNVSVTITAAGCPASDMKNITRESLNPKITATKSAICVGDSTILSSVGFADYLWSNGASTASVKVNPNVTTIYKLTVTDANGCKDTTSQRIIVNNPPIIAIAGNTTFCESDSLEIKVTPNNLASYVWSNGQNKAAFFTKIGGDFSVIATNSNGCKDTTMVTITRNPTPNVTIIGSTTFCTGKSTTISVPNTYTDYRWSNAAVTPSITVGVGGVNSVTVTDEKGCKNNIAVTITESSKLNLVIKGDDFCEGKNTILDAGNFVSYKWNDGSIAQTLTVDKAGKYCVTVSDGSCVGDTCIEIKVFALPTPKIIGKDSICQGIKTTLSLNSTFLAQAWSFGASQTPTIDVGGGNYTVTVTDNNGCVATDTYKVNEINLPTVSIAGDNFLCPKETTTLTANIAGAGYQYTWNNNLNTKNIVVNQDGNYSVTVSNSIGCTVSDSFLISKGEEVYTTINKDICENDLFIFKGKLYSKNKLRDTIVQQHQTICDSIFYVNINVKPTPRFDLKGSKGVCTQELVFITIDANGFVGNFDLVYNIDGVPQPTLSNVKDGFQFQVTPSKTSIYTINKIVFSAGDCPPILGDSVLISVSNLAVSARVQTLYNGFAVKCSGQKNAMLNAVVSSGTSPFQYLWSNGNTTAINNNVGEGLYFVTVTDDNGCTATSDLQINAPKFIDFQLVSTPPSCLNPQGGNILIDSIYGGVGELRYLYTGNNNAQDLVKNAVIKNLTGGNYSVTVSDANGCSKTKQVDMPGLGVLFLNVGADQTVKLGDSILLNPAINFIPKKLVWESENYLTCADCLRPVSQPKNTITYKLTATDSLGCVISDALTIYVDKRRPVYIPNIFSPNDNGTNDKITVFAKNEAILNIKSFKVFDRWGNAIFEQFNFKPNDTTYGWDGTFRGIVLNSQVFTYAAEIEFIDGEIEIFKGDFTLIR